MQLLNPGSSASSNPYVAVGPIASLPASGNTNGAVYKCTDSPYEFFWNGSAWLPFAYGYQVVQPVLANFTEVNVDNSTFDSTHGGFVQTVAAGTSSNDVQALVTAIPASGTYYVDAACTFNTFGGNGGFGVGISAGALAASAIESAIFPWPAGDQSSWELLSWTSTTSGASVQAGPFTPTWIAPMFWFRVEDDRTNLYYSVSTNGYDWHQYYQHARGSILTPAQCGLFVNRFSMGAVVHWLHFSIHT